MYISSFLTQIAFVNDHCIYDRVQFDAIRHCLVEVAPPTRRETSALARKDVVQRTLILADAHVVNYDVDMPRYCFLCRRLLIHTSHTRVSLGLRLRRGA